MLAQLSFLTKTFLTQRFSRRWPRLGGRTHWRPAVEALEGRCVLATAYLAADLVSDQPGVAPLTDPNLVNAWGIAVNPTGAFWVSSEGADRSTLYTGDVGGSPLVKAPLEVSIPGGGEPTGQVFNKTSSFVVSSGGASGPAAFIFASESGAVTGWNPNVPAASSTTAQLGFQATDDAIYTGIALDNNGSGDFLYLADFHNAEIDVLNSSFQPTTLAGSFTDPNLPAGYAPFNVAAIGGKLYVAYAQQDAAAEDEVAGAGLGFVDVFDLNGNFQQRLVSQGHLNAPWAIVQAPAGFGDFSGDLLVGNFGDGRINAYDATTGVFQGTLSQSPGHPIEIDGLWGLAFGNGVAAGDTTTLYYAAGPDDETHGLFGKITANPAGTSPVQAELVGSDLMITGSPGNDHVLVKLKKDQIVVQAGNQVLGTFDVADVGTIQFDGLAGNDHIKIAEHLTVTAILDGGAGNDHLAGGRGNSILLGGPGNDHLQGGKGRDILIGGEDSDHLNAQQNDDLLIGGTTNIDADTAALLQVLDEWTSTDSFNTRIDKLRNGTGGLPKLDDTTVLDDAARDMLQGGPGLDWFFAGANDKVTGKHAGDVVNGDVVGSAKHAAVKNLHSNSAGGSPSAHAAVRVAAAAHANNGHGQKAKGKHSH